MSKILAVFGATGQQGSSIIEHVLRDPELSQQYKLRAITRDVNSERAKLLSDRIEVVRGDVLDLPSLDTALAGVHTVFSMTTPNFTPGGFDFEYNNGKAIADAAVKQGVQYIIFSTLPNVTQLSGGKYTKVAHLDAKAKVENYIRGLPVRSSFFSPGFFMENYHVMPFLAPKPTSDGTWIIARPESPEAQFPMIYATGDTGKFIGAILAEPDKFEGKTLCAATALYTNEEVAAAMSQATGKTVIYKQIPVEQWKAELPFGQDILVEAFLSPAEFGYYGPDSAELVDWAARNARGVLSTYEQYLETHPLELA